MSDLNYPPIIVEALNTWQLFRQMGYPTESVYFELPADDEDGGFPIQVTVLHAGKSVAVRIGKVVPDGPSRKQVEEEWKAASRDYANLDDGVCWRLFQASAARREAVSIIAGMVAAGMGTTPEQIERRQ